MESESHPREVTVVEGKLGNVVCKCEEGWTCVITKTSGPDAGKSFKCGESCTCSIDGEQVSKVEEMQEVGDVGSGAYCKCGEGWSCVISRTQQPLDSQKGFECSAPSTCAVQPR